MRLTGRDEDRPSFATGTMAQANQCLNVGLAHSYRTFCRTDDRNLTQVDKFPNCGGLEAQPESGFLDPQQSHCVFLPMAIECSRLRARRNTGGAYFVGCFARGSDRPRSSWSAY